MTYDKIYIHITLKDLFQVVVPIEIPGDKKDLCHSLNSSILLLHKVMAYLTINGIAAWMKYTRITDTEHKPVAITTNRYEISLQGYQKS